MYIRFVVHSIDPDSGRRQGLFQALGYIADNGYLRSEEQASYEALRKWFRENLPVPESFAKSSKVHAKKVALSWFKPSAVEHIAKMRSFSSILVAYGVQVEVLKQDRPGYVVYEDDYQIVAEPFKDTLT
ncbi:hypothetical protein [Dyella mobilis]|uniref:Uncharacterized protein n=1 Tax=Dyella mobilis TaxID=1849582 RepID=A0ABS2KCQ8_9GAMM|nr:hypothetical protein [Dyella mobilis]MBM7128825.1 hypothetical protein [Dyella mobilis]